MQANFSPRALLQGFPKALTVAAASAVLLGACGISPATTPDGQVAFPAVSQAWLPEGTFVNVQNLRQMQPGLSKNQVYALLGEPHFSAGVIAVHVWNYLFNFRQADGSVVQCQYQVQYGDHARVKATYWHTARCAGFVVAQPAGEHKPVRERARK
jgi:outer membrane protein assembly factor BamE (lipoprotein component of BamABCDE complex)